MRPGSARSHRTMRSVQSMRSPQSSPATASEMSPGSVYSNEGGRCRSACRTSNSGFSSVPVPYAAFTAAAKALDEGSSSLSASLASSQTVTFSEKLLRQASSYASSHASLGSNTACTTPIDAVAPWAAAAILKAQSMHSQPSNDLACLSGVVPGALMHAIWQASNDKCLCISAT